ncbi:NAD(P)/FAD-dependent oxidoreductase [Mycoplasmopsis primatum]|uniref:NAD(P)/FAD-dependent oxidoreductase n=1 Tax=Mycoplasmopsis primatum TaxID=55604 RepID=UPI00049773B7|nr:FAD-dependent oxidoreductase [Mycoplasmopsis primatum]
MEQNVLYDVVIVGSGPGGLNAALYASRSGLKTLIIEKEVPGGKINSTTEVENWLGTKKVSGYELADMLYSHAMSFGSQFKSANVIKINHLANNLQEIVLQDNSIIQSKTVIIATGLVNRKPSDIENFDKFDKKGISYCGVCDGPLFKNKVLYVLGDGNSAFEEALYLTAFASEVNLIVRGSKFYAEKVTVDKVKNHPKIKILFNTYIKKLEGENFVEKIYLIDENGKIVAKHCDGLFPMIGFVPVSDFISHLDITNKDGFIVTNEKMQTKIQGIYAIGDIRQKEIRQIVTAASDGAIAAKFIWNELK